MSSFADKFKTGVRFSASMITRRSFKSGIVYRGRWKVVCRGPDGNVKWTDYIHNLVVDTGVDHSLDVTLSNGTQIATWFIMLIDATPVVGADDTMALASRSWVEVENYSEAVRQTFVDGGVSAKSLDNSASVAAFSMNATVTVGGAALTDSNVKGGVTGTLYAAGAFTGGNKNVDNLDTVQVTATFTGDDDGA